MIPGAGIGGRHAQQRVAWRGVWGICDMTWIGSGRPARWFCKHSYLLLVPRFSSFVARRFGRFAFLALGASLVSLSFFSLSLHPPLLLPDSFALFLFVFASSKQICRAFVGPRMGWVR